MVEPAGSIILNTLLQGRTTFALHPGTIYSASKAMPRPSRVHLTPGFFSPQPRSAKGKERMTDPARADVLSGYSAQCREWSCRMRISVYCSGRSNNALVEEEEIRRRPRNVRRTRRVTQTLPRHSSGVISLQRGQARHASHSSDRPPPDSDPPSSSTGPSVLDPPTESAAVLDSGSLQTAEETLEDLDSTRQTPNPDPPLEDDISETHSPPESSSSPNPPETIPPPLSEIEKQLMDENIQYLRSLIVEHNSLMQPDKIWHAYETVQIRGQLSALSSAETVWLAEKILFWAEARHQTDKLEILHKWGERVRQLLNTLDSAASGFDQRFLMARALALEGDLQKALNHIHPIQPHSNTFIACLRAVESIFVSTWRHHDRIRAIELLIQDWKTVGLFLLTESSRLHYKNQELYAVGASLRKTAFAVASGISLPSVLLADKQYEWDEDQRRHLGDFLVEAFIRHKLPMDSVSVLREMKRQNLKPTFHISLLLIRALAREELYSEAHALYAAVEQDRSYEYLFTGLYLYSHEGQEKWTLEYFDRINASGLMNSKVVLQLMYAYAVKGDTAKTLEVFQQYFPEDEHGLPANSPLIEHFTVGIFAHAQRGDFAGTVPWLDGMRKAGLQPDAHVFTTILKSFALRGDLNSISSLLNQMRSAGHAPNIVTYTTIMTLLAHRKDPASAEAIYARAVKEGLLPDSIMIATIMNAHIEAGSWKGVIKAFDFVRSSPHMKLTVGIYNLLLKAYLQIAAPFRVVSRVFNQLERLRIRPDAYTFALLIQSACDARQMHTASEIFTQMEKLSEQWGSSRHITTWTMTIIMAGFLRANDNERAMAVYEDMLGRGLKPTAITYGIIIGAYGREGTEESFNLAIKFIENVEGSEERAWDAPPHGRLSARDYLYLPLMQSYASSNEPDQVERLFQKMLDDGGEPSLSILTTLLDAYARVNDIDSVLKLWPQIYQLGVKYSTIPFFSEGSDEQQKSRVHTFVLCAPLSRYIETLSKAGMHNEIAEEWRRFQEAGFSFSADNWNQLAMALLRAGDVERCFAVLEKVFIPYSQRSELLRQQRETNPTSPLSLELPATETMPLEKPLVGRARAAATHLGRYIERAAPDFADPEHADDLAHHLHVLHRISPMWNTWKPRHDVLRGLFDAVLRLRAGYPIDAVARETDELLHGVEAFEQQQSAARSRLQEIYRAYPEAVMLVEQFERKEQRRLGRWYAKVYSWAEDRPKL